MAVYSYYYGASSEKGIGIRAQSPELQSLPLASELHELASMHALESSEHSGEMLSFLLERDGYSILGVSYIESPKSSGYNRSAPCSLQYIAPMQDLDKAAPELSRIINFVNFQKPNSAAPQAMKHWPLNESGYYFHNSPSVLAPLVDGMVRVALSAKEEILLVGLPKGKNSEYAFARYTIAELMAYLPVPLRANIHFFTGLPVAEGGDAVRGFENAVKYGANVIFCPNEHYKTVLSSCECIGVDMEAPGRSSGAFANYIAQVPDISDGLAAVDNCLPRGGVTYDALNSAAQQAASGDVVTIPKLREELGKREKIIRQMEQQIENGNKEFQKLQRDYDKLQRDMDRMQGGIPRSPYADDEDDEGGGKGILKWILIGVLGLALAVGGFFLGSSGLIGGKKTEEKPAEQAAAVVTSAPDQKDENDGTVPENTAEPGSQTEEDNKQTEEPGNPDEPAAQQPEENDNLNEPASQQPEENVSPDGQPAQQLEGNSNPDEPASQQPEENDNPNEPASQQPEGNINPDEPEQQDDDNPTAPEAFSQDDDDNPNTVPDENADDSSNTESLMQEYPVLAELLKGNQSFTIRKNSPKAQVEELQRRLLQLGYDLGNYGADGDYGNMTRSAVKDFQKNNGLTVNGNGNADRATVEMLLSPDAVGPAGN